MFHFSVFPFLLLAIAAWSIRDAAAAAATVDGDFEPFIGWKGEAYRPEVLWNPTKPSVNQPGGSEKPWIEILSWSPRAFVYHNFLTPEECDYFIDTAASTLKRSTIVRQEGEAVSEGRSSFGTFITRNQDKNSTKIADKVAKWVGIPAINHEDIQVLRYGQGQKYDAHKDVIGAITDGKPGENPRIATVLLYLNDVESGGETSFPRSYNWADPTLQVKNGPWSPCAHGNVATKPKKGDALLFFSVWPNGQFDENSIHQGCPVLEGEKWTATVWIHANPWREDQFHTETDEASGDPGDCEDLHPRCAEWAKKGECERTPAFMVGVADSNGGLGKCRLSCKSCEVCESGDEACHMRNRKRAGYEPVSQIDGSTLVKV
ncbi:hypothetical protein BSKO_02126 [Bryopsis sp. KO-2023]|nr:hypothetical protein BSKO_02126 [Bryopsis sp. KO-2023]